MKEFWDDRYRDEAYAYGVEPNDWFRERLATLTPGALLLPAEGEGRNAVFAATLGWDVRAIDFSEEGKRKALRLAASRGVSIRYDLEDVHAADFGHDAFDAVALIYAHHPPQLRETFHTRCIDALRKGGTLILEAFARSQITRASGGPRDPSVLYDEEMLLSDFASMKVEHVITCTTILDEGAYHSGEADVVRLVATKR